MNKECNSTLYEQFNQDCQVIELKYEYPGYVGYEKYAIVTDLSTEELDKYRDILSEYSPYMVIGTYFSEARREFRRNEKKHEMRSLRGHFFAIDEDFDEHHPEVAAADYLEQLIIAEQNKELEAAISQLNEMQRKRVLDYFFAEKTYRTIAAEEGVDHRAVNRSVESALRTLRKILDKKYPQNGSASGNK